MKTKRSSEYHGERNIGREKEMTGRQTDKRSNKRGKTEEAKWNGSGKPKKNKRNKNNLQDGKRNHDIDIKTPRHKKI